VEVLVLLLAFVVAISDTFAFALDSEDVSVSAELARTNLKSVLFFIFKGEFRGRNLDQNDLRVKLLIVEGERRAYHGLK